MTRRRKARKAKPMAADMAMLEIENPYWSPSAPEQHRRVMAARALRDDPIGQMHSRHQLTEPQYMAGRQVQADYERSGQGRIPGQDTSREPVQGGPLHRTAVTDAQMAARDRLERWKATLGQDGWRLCAAVLIDKRTVREATLHLYQEASPAKVTYAGHRLRECLDALAKRMGLVT
jgi:hypothetical protein